MSSANLSYREILDKFNSYEGYSYDIGDIHCWKNIKHNKNKTDFLNYIKKYPNGRYINEAKKELCIIEDFEAWEKALKTNTINSYKEYLKKYPKGNYTDKAKNKIKQIEESDFWDKIITKDTVKAYEDYLQKYPSGKYKTKAKKRIFEIEDEKAWQKACRYDSINTYTSYINKFPNGKYISKAKAKLEELKQDKNAWEEAKNKNTISSYEQYINNYPNGKFIDSAYDRIAKLKQNLKKEREKEKIEEAVNDFIYLLKETDIMENSYFFISLIVILIFFSITFNDYGIMIIVFFIGLFIEGLIAVTIMVILDIVPNIKKLKISVSKNEFENYKIYDTIVINATNEHVLITHKHKDNNEYKLEITSLKDIANNHQKIKNAIYGIDDYKKKFFMLFYSISFVIAVIVHLTFGREVSVFFN